MIRQFISVTGLSLLLVSPAAAQFGVGGRGRSKGATFQELNEQAKQMQDGGAAGGAGMDMGQMEAMWGDAMDAFKDPEMMKQMEDAMKMMAEMTPEQLEKQMQDAMKMLTEGDMMKTMMDNMNQEELISYLEQSGSVPPEEMAKMRADPAYLEAKMAESFEQMGSLFQNPEVMKGLSGMMGGMTDLMKNPSMIEDMMKTLGGNIGDDKIEEARLQILADPSSMGGLFDSEEMQDILKDPKKWRDSVKEGQGMFDETGAAAGEL